MSEMTVVEVLKKARALISDPNHWTQGQWAAAVDGSLPDDDQIRVAWCGWGAVVEIAGRRRTAIPYLDDVARQMGFEGCIGLNDRTDHATVLAMYDAAIDTAEILRALPVIASLHQPRTSEDFADAF